jgi:hypothetical protein
MSAVRNNIKPLMWLYPNSLSFWDNQLFDSNKGFWCLEIHSHQIGEKSLNVDLAKVERSKKGWKTSDVWFSNNLIDKPCALELSDAKRHVAVAENEIRF